MKKILIIGLLAFLSFSSCDKDGSVNVFSLEDDKKLGAQLKAEIEANPSQYPLLSESQYPEPYKYLNAMRDKILASGKVIHKDDFTWELKIIKDDAVLNAFCAPGGYIYIYTGIIKYLDNENELAGVLGHEMGHADHRHSTDQMSKQYGWQLMFDVILGKNQGMITQMAQGLIALQYSKSDETEADEASVEYLCPTTYKADGAAGFFQKIVNENGSSGSDFLSTHPSPEKRVENITLNATKSNCGGTVTTGDLSRLKAMLP